MNRFAQPLALLAVTVAASSAHARGLGEGSDPTTDELAELEGVDINEKLGVKVPLDLEFLNQDGKRVRLQQVLNTGMPTFLTFNYSDCPLLCSVQLSGLISAMAGMGLVPGKHFQILTVGLDPAEKPERASETRKSYIERYQLARKRMGLAAVSTGSMEKGWTFLVSEQRTVKALADSVGFGYRRLARKQQYLHPSTFMVLSADAEVVEYIYGVDFKPAVLDTALTTAALGIESEAAEKFILSCYHYEPPKGLNGYRVMQIVGAFFAVGVVLTIGGLHWRSKHPRANKESGA